MRKLVLITLILPVYALGAGFWDPSPRPANVTLGDPCKNILVSAYVREVISPIYDHGDLYTLLYWYQEVGRAVASAETAYDPEDYNLGGTDGLRQHCGAMVWFIQREFGGRAVLKEYVAQDGSVIFHMHNEDIPSTNLVNGDKIIAHTNFDLTKGQFDNQGNDLRPIQNNELSYRGKKYVHTPGENFIDEDYRWDQDALNPPRPQMETFALRLKMGDPEFNPTFR